MAEREPAASFKNHVMQSGSAGSRTSTGGRSASESTGRFNGCGRRRKICRNDCDQRLATLGDPHRRIPSRVRCIALLGASAEYMGSKRNVNHAKAIPVNAAEPPDEKVMSLAEGANVLLAGVWVVIGHESLKGGRIRWM